MSIFGRRNKRGPRTAEERERARREREARRAAREGRPAPVWDDDALTADARVDWAEGAVDGGLDRTPPASSAEPFDDAGPAATAGDDAQEPAEGRTDAPGASSADAAARGDAAQPHPLHPGELDATQQAAARHGAGAADTAPEPAARHGAGGADAAPGPVAGGREGEADAASPHRLARRDPDATREWDDGLGEWVELPPEPPVERPAAARGEAPTDRELDPRPAWERTDAWETSAEHGLDVWEAPSGGTRDARRPTLGEELSAVERGEHGAWADEGAAWSDDDGAREPGDAVRADDDGAGGPGDAVRADDDGGPKTVEWDVLGDRPKHRPVPRSGPAGLDDPTVEWDVLADGPRRARSRGGTGRGGTRARPAAAARRSMRTRTLPPPPPRPGQRPPRGRYPRTGALVAACALVALVLVAYGLNAVFQPFKGDGGAPVRVTIPASSTLGDVGEALERAGVVDSGFLFALRARLAGASVQAGAYTLRADMAYGDAIDALERGPEAQRTITITIPEGRSRREARDLVVKAGLKGSYLEATTRADGFNPRRYGASRRVRSLEGFLFPATYELKAGATSKELVAAQLAAFRKNIAKVDMRHARARNLTTYDVLIIASMVEREATLARERRLIAAVIYNRLRQGMPLGIDATIRYATRNWTRPLRQSELTIDSAYNTRLRTGLPPTPIGSPGLASIRAAADPAKVDYLYYVVKPNGNGAHSFSATIEEFERDVAAYNRERERRGGRSPADAER